MDVLEILEQLLDQDKLAGRSGADPKDYLLLLEVEDLVELDQLELFLSDVLA